eukprot:635194-Rhodomonas_salina.1
MGLSRGCGHVISGASKAFDLAGAAAASGVGCVLRPPLAVVNGGLGKAAESIGFARDFGVTLGAKGRSIAWTAWKGALLPVQCAWSGVDRLCTPVFRAASTVAVRACDTALRRPITCAGSLAAQACSKTELGLAMAGLGLGKPPVVLGQTVYTAAACGLHYLHVPVTSVSRGPRGRERDDGVPGVIGVGLRGAGKVGAR